MPQRRSTRRSNLGRAARLWSESLETRRLLIAIASDQTVTGSVATPASTVDYEITLGVGDSLLATIGESATSAFDPGITIIRPDAVVQASDSSELGTLITANSVAQAGTWKIRVFDGGANDAGAYRLTVVAIDGIQAHSDNDGGPITAGQRDDGTILLGDMDVHTVAATAGDNIIVSDTWLGGDASFQPFLRVYGPTGTLLQDDGSTLGTELTVTAATTGTYYLVTSDSLNPNFSDRNLGGGTYRLRVVKVPATQGQDDPDGGAITSGQRREGAIDLGDLDVFTAALSAGDSVIASLAERGGDTAFDPRLRIFGPTGVLITSDGSLLGTELGFVAPSAGTYYFVVSDGLNFNFSDRQRASGLYTFRMVKVPATQEQDDADGGAISSGQRKDAAIELGDLDVYTTSISAGDSIVATVAERSGDLPFTPRLRIFGPNGALVPNADDDSLIGTELAFTATSSGTYYLVVSDALNFNFSDRSMAAGSYALRFTKAPGVQVQDDADGGAITNGQRRNGMIELGDIDTYTIGALAGEKLLVSAVERRGNRAIDPHLRIYGPTGIKLFDDASTLGSEAALNITVTGNYYFVITDGVNFNFSDRQMTTGEYTLRAIRAPLVPTNDDADGGPITSGERKLGTLDRGDFDVFTFAADSGDDLLINVASLTTGDADPYVRIYAPNGTLIGSSDGAANLLASAYPLTATGTYLAVVSDVLNFNASDRNFESGDYAMSLALTPATQVTDADSGTLPSGQSRAGAVSIGDIDVWTFNATAGVPFTVNLLDTAAGLFDPQLSVFGPTGAVLFNSSDATSRTFTIANPTASGTYTAFVFDAGGTESGAYAIALNTAAGADNFAPRVLRGDYRFNAPLPELRFEFSEPVTPSFSIEDFTLENRTTSTTLDNFSLTTTFDAAKDNFVITFDSFDGRVLPDGNYRLTIAAGNIRDAANNPMPSNYVFDFFVLAGDANRDRAVNFADLVLLAQNYNGLDRTFAEGNFNYSSGGEADFADLVLLAQRYNTTLAAAMSASLSAPLSASPSAVSLLPGNGPKSKRSIVEDVVR